MAAVAGACVLWSQGGEVSGNGRGVGWAVGGFLSWGRRRQVHGRSRICAGAAGSVCEGVARAGAERVAAQRAEATGVSRGQAAAEPDTGSRGEIPCDGTECSGWGRVAVGAGLIATGLGVYLYRKFLTKAKKYKGKILIDDPPLGICSSSFDCGSGICFGWTW